MFGWRGQGTGGGETTRTSRRRSPLPDAILQASRGVGGGQRQEGGSLGRMEEEVFQQVFLTFHKMLLECPCVLWIGSQQAMYQFSAEERRGALLWKVKVLLSKLSSLLILCDFYQ